MPTVAKERWTESRVAELLEKRFPTGAYVFLRQVRNGTGFKRSTVRTADAFAVSCYPSRGLHFTGIEIKVSYADWRKELAAPDKADDLQRFCKYWYVAAPKGVIPLAEVPDNWGLIECEATRTIATKDAPALNPIPPDMLLICSMLRNSSGATVPVAEVNARIEAAKTQAVGMHRSRTEQELNQLKQSVADFEKSSGVKIDRWYGGSIGDAVRFVQETGIMRAHQNAIGLATRHEEIAKQLRTAAEKIEGRPPNCPST